MLTLNGICWCLLVSFGVWRRLFVSYGVWRCEEGVWGVSKRISECCLWTCLRFGSLCESIWVFRLCMVQQLLNIGKSPEGKIPHTWHFWNLKIQKPPYISFLKIIGLLHFWNFWVRQKKITIHSLFGSPFTIEYNTLQYNAMPDGFVWKMGNDLEKSGWSWNRPEYVS